MRLFRLLILLCCALLAFCGASRTSRAAVPAPSFPAQTYQINAAHTGAITMEGFGLPLAKRWSVDLSNNVSHPLIANGRVFVTVADNSSRVKRVVALDSATGTVLWQQPIGGYYWRVELAYENETVFTISTDGVMQAWDAPTGALKWQSQMPGQYAFSTAPTAVNGVVYVGGAGSGGTVYAVSEATGSVLWTQSVENGDDSSPVVVNGSLFVSYSGPQTYCFNAANGAAVWHYDSGIEGGGGKTLAYYNGKLYDRVTHSGIVFDAATGKLLNLAFDYGPIPAFDAGRMYLVSGGVLFAKDASSMSQIWSQAGNGGFTVAPVVINGLVFAGTDRGDIYGFDGATGTLLWHDNPGGGPILAPDEQNVASVLVGLGAGEGSLLVPSGHVLTAYGLAIVAGPYPPSALTASLGSGQIALHWQDNSGIETGFKVERKVGAGSFALLATLAANTVDYTDTDAQADTTYTYRVRSTNASGDSSSSNEVVVVVPAVPPSAPSDLAATAVNSTQIDLQWVDRSSNETGFKIVRKTGNGAFLPLVTIGANITTYSDVGLQPSTQYSYEVIATNNGSDSAPSNVATATTPRTPPNAPSNLIATATSGTRVDLHWTDNSSDEDGFEVERAVGGGDFATVGAVGANTTAYSDTTVAPETTYTYRVRATAGGSVSSYAVSAPVTTPASPLVPPSNLTAVLAGGQVTLSWTDNTSNEDSFLIDRAVGNNPFVLFKVVGANATSYIDTSLAPSTTYTYRVRTNLGSTASDPSNTASITTPPAAPAAPTNLVASAVGLTEIDLTWTDASPNEDGFHIERSTDGTNFAPLGSGTANQTTYADTSLTPGTTYYYRVLAFNTGGDSIASNTANATTAPTAPDLPSGLQVTARTQTSITLGWTAGMGATSYEVERGDGVTFSRAGTPTATAFTDSGLQPNTPYTYRVRAVNAGGFSGYTANVTGTTLPNPPATPVNLQANPLSATSIRVTWSAPTETVTGYRLDRSGDSGVSWTPLGRISASDTGFLDAGLQPSTTYQYRLRASNAGGDGLFAGPVSATTLAPPPNPPAPPQNLRTVGMTASSIQLAWNASIGATSYTVERKSGTGDFEILGSIDSADYADAGVTAGVAYTYRVKAANAGGESGYSTALAVTIPAGGKLKLSSTTLNFGKVARGKTVQKTLTLTNTGRGLLVVNVGTADLPFNVALGAGSYTLRPKQSQKVTLRFAPTSKTAYSRSLIVTTTDPAAASVSVVLTGSGK